MLLRLCVPIAVLILAACTNASSWSAFSVSEAGFSIEYPQEWEIEDGRPASELLAIHPTLSSGEELTPSNALYVWIVRKQLFPSLKEFALSQKSDFENTSCDAPVETLVTTKKYPGLKMHCSNGTENFYMEGENHHIAVSFDANSPYAKMFERIKDGIEITGAN